MSWNTANEIFDPVAQALVDNNVNQEATLSVLITLIRNLQSEDWDTEDESLEKFSDCPIVVEAFKKCGIPDRWSFDEDWTPSTDNRLKVAIKRLDKGLPIPAYAVSGDAGVDLYSTESFILTPGQRRLASTGIALDIPKGYVGLVHPRSGLAHQFGLSIVNAPGTIDAGYRGEVKVNLINLDPEESVQTSYGARIAQLVFQKVEEVSFVEVDELSDSERGSSGHGSTGF